MLQRETTAAKYNFDRSLAKRSDIHCLYSYFCTVPGRRRLIVVERLGKDYGRGEALLSVLDDVTFRVAPGEFVAITGPSGSGKSTLLGLLAGLDRPTRGLIRIDGVDLTVQTEEELSRLRGRKIGFVFQSFQLMQTLTALENVRVPAEILGDERAAEGAAALLSRVGLARREHHYPSQLSGGEMQRTAIARAAVTRPPVFLADEPTGNLDSANGRMVMELLLELNENATLVLVTHNPDLARMADREIRLKDGRISAIIRNRGTGSARRKGSAGGKASARAGAAPAQKRSGTGIARGSSRAGRKK